MTVTIYKSFMKVRFTVENRVFMVDIWASNNKSLPSMIFAFTGPKFLNITMA